MDAAIRAKWIEALRSGKYEQAALRLKSSEGKYCCLGVLAEVQGIDLEAEKPGGLQRYGDTSYLLGKHDAGLGLDKQNTLSNKNDRGCPFPEIAAWIEQIIPADPV